MNTTLYVLTTLTCKLRYLSADSLVTQATPETYKLAITMALKYFSSLFYRDLGSQTHCAMTILVRFLVSLNAASIMKDIYSPSDRDVMQFTLIVVRTQQH